MKILFALILLPTTLLASGFVPATFTANYEESLISVATGKEKKSYGKIDYKFPGHIRFEVTSPNPTTYVSNNQKSWLYNPPFVAGEEGQVTIEKAGKTPLSKLLDSFKNGLEGSKYFSKKVVGNDLILTFNKDSQKDFSLKDVILHGTKDAKSATKLSEFASMTLNYADGRKATFKFIEFKEDVTLSAETFTFTVPPKTKVIQ